MRELLVSLARSDGRRAGVFEHDGAAGHFYLYDPAARAGAGVLDSLHVVSGACELEEADVEVRWDATESIVGLLIRGHVWAVFDCRTGAKLGGDFVAGASPNLPAGILAALSRS